MVRSRVAFTRHALRNALRPGYPAEMLRKVMARVREDDETARGRAWCTEHADDPAAVLGRLAPDLWAEAEAYQRALAERAERVLASLDVRMGGGGDVAVAYFLTRYLRPATVVETGVAAGFTSTAILAALAANGSGHLWSSDFPYFRQADPERHIGVLVPDELRDRWTLLTRGDRVNLPRIVAACGRIDLVHYDSDKSRAGRQWALELLRPRLSSRGVVVVDDINDNLHFRDWAASVPGRTWVLASGGRHVGVVAPAGVLSPPDVAAGVDAPGDDATADPAEVLDLSVILPTLNGRDRIGEQLDAVVAQTAGHTWELVVVDNGSTDGTGDLVRARLAGVPNARVVDAPDRASFSYVRNVGVEAARGRSVVFVDDDDIVGEGWVEAMADALDEHELAASHLEYERLNDAAVGERRSAFQSSGIERMFGIPVVTGAGQGCRRRLWLDLGGNDDDFGSAGEDFDFVMRAVTERGVEPVFVADAIYHYRLRAGVGNAFRQARRHGLGQVDLYRRHAPGSISRWAVTADAAKRWVWIAVYAVPAAFGVRRELWAASLGGRWGRLLGSIGRRTWLP